MKEKYQEQSPELRIRGVSKKTRDEIKNIATNLNMTVSTLLRLKISEIIAAYPDKMKQPPLDY